MIVPATAPVFVGVFLRVFMGVFMGVPGTPAGGGRMRMPAAPGISLLMCAVVLLKAVEASGLLVMIMPTALAVLMVMAAAVPMSVLLKKCRSLPANIAYRVL